MSYKIPLSKAKYVTLYHGTSKDKLPKILKEGLNPNISFLSRRKEEIGMDNAEPKVCLTGSIKSAEHHAKMGSETAFMEARKKLEEKYGESNVPNKEQMKLFKNQPVILKVTVPKEMVEEDLPLQTNKIPEEEKRVAEGTELLSTYQIGCLKNIPPRYIKVMKEEEIKKRLKSYEKRVKRKWKEWRKIAEKSEGKK
jgi:hypothetical protein